MCVPAGQKIQRKKFVFLYTLSISLSLSFLSPLSPTDSVTHLFLAALSRRSSRSLPPLSLSLPLPGVASAIDHIYTPTLPQLPYALFFQKTAAASSVYFYFSWSHHEEWVALQIGPVILLPWSDLQTGLRTSFLFRPRIRWTNGCQRFARNRFESRRVKIFFSETFYPLKRKKLEATLSPRVSEKSSWAKPASLTQQSEPLVKMLGETFKKHFQAKLGNQFTSC